MTFDLERYKARAKAKPKRKKDPDGTEYIFHDGAQEWIEIETIDDPTPRRAAAKGANRKQPEAEAFAIMPLWWARRANDDCGKYGPPNIQVCAVVMHGGWKAKGKAFPLPNVGGVGTKVRLRSIRGLEEAGLITVQWRSGKSPIITSVEGINRDLSL